jgi:serine/threonine-protein kinase
MTSVSLSALVEVIRQLAAEAGRRDELAQLAASCTDAPALVREMQCRQWLTAFQASTLLAGQGKTLVVGPYVLLDQLGQGATSRVYRARHTQTKQQVALKVLPPAVVQSPRIVSRFQREAQAAMQLDHPGIARAQDAGEAGGAFYLAMEYVEGINLLRLVKEQGPLPPPLACDLIRQAALALEHAHTHDLVHRDVKPSNLMVVRSPNHPPVVKILDFGLARFLADSDEQDRLTRLGSVVGTVDFISPEQALDARKADARSDVFSLGATLYYILTGKAPYPGKDLAEKIAARVTGEPPRASKWCPRLPTGLEEVVMKMMARNPDDRYGSAAAVAQALAPFGLAGVRKRRKR